MATEEEAREAADGKEVQMEDVDLEPFHMQTRLDSKLSSMEIKNVAESIDSTEGTLKIPEDQVLVDAPSEIKRPLEHNLNGTSSSLNGHMDEENKISNEQLQGDSKKDREQVQAALGGESTDQNNKINKEANDYLNHGETTTEDSSLLKHENKDKEPMPDTLKTNSDIDQSKLVVDQHQLDHNMDPAKATEDTQPASMENIPNAEVVTEARAEVQSPLYPNLDDSNAILDTVDGSTETDEAATGDAAHLEHRKRFPEDTSTDKHTEVMVKEEDQQSKQAGAINADAVQEDIPKCEESGVSKEMPKSEHADESMTDAQEVLHQEPSEDTNGLAYEKREQTSQQSSMAASGDTTSEPPVDIQVQNKKSLEEMKDADAVDTEAAMQERYIAFEEGTPESHVAATEQDSVETNNTESVETHNLKIVPSSEEEKVEHDVTARGSTTSSQEVDNVGSTEAIMDKVAENIVEVTNAATVDEAKKEKNMPGIESEVTKSTEPVDTEEDSDQRYFSLLDNSAQGDDTPVSEKKHTGSALEKNEIKATRTESVTGESKASVSEEPSPQDYVTESEATSDSKEVNTTESSEAIEGDKDIKTREILDQNSMNSAGKSTQENNAPESELISQIQPEELESEEMKVNELVQVNESSPEISATVFHKEIQENNPATSELHVMESGGMRNIETTEVQVTPHQLNCDHPEEKTTEETITSSEPQTLEPESVKKMNDIEASKPQDISQQSIISPSEKSVPEEIAKEDIVTIESNDGHQQPKDPESAELDEIKTNKSQEIASSSIVFNYEEPTSQDDVTVTEPNSETQAENLLSAEVMEDTENVKGHGALSGEVAKEENVETETIADMSPVQEPELEEAKNTEPVGTEDNITPTELPAERMEKETVEIEAIPYESRVASIRDVAENDILTAITSHADIQPVLKQESVEDKCIDTTEKPRETQQIVSSPSDELIPAENKMAMTEPACETPLQNVIAQGIKDCEDAPTDQISNLDSFPTPGEADQENKLPGIEPTSDDQELGSTEQTIGIKAMETEDHQQHRVFTLEETAVNKKSNVDDHQVHEEKLDNEAMEVESVLEQSNISTPYNAHEDRSELGTDPDCCVQQAEQVESSKDSEESKHLKEEDTSDQKIVTLDDTATEGIVQDEISPPAGMEKEHEPKSLETSDVQEVQELGSIEQTRGVEATETEDHQQYIVSTLDEPEVDKKPNVDDHQVHEEKPAELIDNGAMEAEPVLEQSNISTTDNPPEERSERGTDPYCCVQPAQQVESSKDSEESNRLNEEETSDQEIITLEDTTTEDIVQDEINPPADMEQEHEPKSLETSDVQEVQELDSIEETRGVEATEIKDHQQHRVSTLEESAVDKPNVDDHQVHEEKPAELKDNEAMEAEPVLEQSNISTPDNAPAQQVESSKDSEESKHLKEEETSDQTIITLEDTATKDTVKDEIDLPVGMEQEHERKSLETSDVQEVQDLGSIEQNRGTEATETEDHQQHRVSTLEEPAVDKKPNVDDHQVHDEKPAELKDNEAMEAEPVLEQSNISTSDNAPEERSELGTDPDCCVHPAQQVESSRDSEDSKLLKEEETSDQKIITLEDTGTVGIVEDEFDPPVSMEQEHEQKSVEEVKDINANEAKEDFHTNQPDALDKLASESNTATAEPTYDIQHLDDFETKETKSIEGIDDGDISCQQAGVATSVDPSPTDNEIAPQEHPVESHEENLGNETENEMLDRGMKEEIHRSAEPKDDAFHLGETIPTTKKSKNLADEDVIQSSGEDTLESSNGTDQIKGGKKAGIEHNSSQKPSEHHGENITHVQDKDINRESVTERGTTEISQALIGNDAQASQDVTEEDGTTKSGEQTNDHRQAGDVEHRPQTCESSVDDEDVQKVSFDERHKEDEEVETQKEQLQADEQKHKDESDDASNEPLVESKNTNNGTTNRTRETDMLEAGQSLRTSEDSTPSITNTPVEDITGTEKGVEDENWPNSTNTSDADAKMEKQEDQENTGKDNIVPMDSTRGQDETTDEITNEELEPSLASCVQDISHTSPSKDHILENDPTAVPYNVGSGGHEDKECTNKVNDDLPAIQELEKEIVTGMQENKEMQNETKGAHHVESHTKAEVEDMFQLHSNEPYNVDTKIDDTVHNTTVQPRETEEIGENKGFSSIYKPVVETSEQNNVEQDLSIQHKNQVEDEKLESTEDNAVEMEATQQKVDTSNVDISNDDQLSTSNALTKHETESADDVLQLETEGNTFELCEKTEASNTSVLETVTLTEEICDKVTEVEGGLSDKSLKTFDDARRNLDVSSVVRETNEESMNEDMEENKLAAPEHPTMDETTPKQQISVSEKPLPIEPEEPDDQIHKKQDEKDMYEPNFGDDQKEVEQDLPVSNFLMNLILGKENSNANGHSEPEAETKQEETRDDNSCSIIPKQEESLVLPPTENNMECKLTVEQEQKDVKCPEEKYEVVEEQSHDFKLGTETSLETDAEFNKNSHHLELPPYQDKMQDEISNEILSKEPAEAFAKIEAKDLAIPSIIQDDKEVDNVCQENTEAATQNEIRSIKNNLDDFKNTKISEEDTPGEGETGLLPECLNEARSVNSVSEQTLLLTDSGMTDAKSLPSPNPVCEIQDKTIESSSIGATSIPDIQVESEEDKIEKKQPTTTATGDVAEEHVEISNDNPQKSIGPETTSNEQEPQIAQQVNDTEIVLGHEKKILAGSSSTFMDKKEDSNFSVKEGNNIQTAVEIQADGPNMQVNQDKQEAADIKNETESEKLKESNIQEKQGNDTEEKSPKECHEEDQQFLVKEEIGVKEEDVHQTVQSHTETVKIKANDEQKLSDSEVQERDFNVFSPKDVREPHESFVDTANPECRTDEEQSPKADESNISEQKTYEGKTKDEEKIKSFTDEEMKTEAQVTGEKAAHKKQNLLSGVGSKVKHQLAKVKKAITGKPGHTKPKSPKA